MAEGYENVVKHDVMAQIKAYGDAAPTAKGIIHLGATSQYVVDNTDIIRIRESMILIQRKLVECILKFSGFADTHKHVATVGMTHGQPAQPTTVGKRAITWAYDLYLALEGINERINMLRFRGARGTTGTEASFKTIFEGDDNKVVKLNEMLCDAFGFSHDRLHNVVGQVYPRVADSAIIASLANLAAVSQKIATDIRILASHGELSESFEQNQVGSSAMPYKRNPIKCEKVCGLAKVVMGYVTSSLMTTSEQWLERSLDDSSTRRVILPESFLAIDGILEVLTSVIKTLKTNPEVIEGRLNKHMKYAVTEDIMLLATMEGADRQEVHELLRQHCVNEEIDDLRDAISNEELFNNIASKISIDPTGRACDQVTEFIEQIVMPLRDWYKEVYHSEH